jgi:DNA-binding transcriptional ArsR family regulator
VTVNAPDPSRHEKRPATEAEAKALASAVRLRILRLCLDRPMTNKEIARRLEANPATVLHHVRTLVDTGFLAAQPARRGTRGAREVPYLATRKSWRLELAGMNDGSAMVGAFLDEIRHVDLRQSFLNRLGLRLSPEEHKELRTRLYAILDEFQGRPPTPGGRPYSVFVSIHEDVTRDPPG